MTNENYVGEKMTFVISGSTTVPGVTLRGLPGRPVMSVQGGTYTAKVEYGWNGTVTPIKPGYDFDPPTIQYDNVISDLTNQSYTPTIQKRTISGRILSQKGQPVADVFVSADDGGSATTDATGEYSLTVDHGWLGRVTPIKEGYTFNPATKPYTPVTTDQTQQNFSAIVKMFTIKDTLNTPIPGVTITAKDNTGTVDTTTTDSKGEFSVQVPYGWTGEIIPTKEGLMFNPPSQTYTNVTADMVKGQPVAIRPPTPPAQPAQTVTPPSTTPGIPTPGTESVVTPPETMPGIPKPGTEPVVTAPGTSSGIPKPGTTTQPETPKTQVEQDIARILEELNRLRRVQAGQVEPATAPGAGQLAGPGGQR